MPDLQGEEDAVAGKRGITPETALLFSFGTPPEFPVDARSAYDLARSGPPRSIKRLGAAG